MKYLDTIESQFREFYSINFLLAGFEEIQKMERDMSIIENTISCEEFDTQNYQTIGSYKQISTVISKFEIQEDHDKDK